MDFIICRCQLISYPDFQWKFVFSPEVKEMHSAHHVSKIWGSTFPTQFWRRQPTRSIQLHTRSSSQITKGWPLSSGWRRWKHFFFVLLFFFIHVLLCLKGKCKNLAHPATPTIIHEFFYTDKDCLTALFHNNFEHCPWSCHCPHNHLCKYAFLYQMTCANNSLRFKIVLKNMLTSVIGRQSI